MPEPRHGVGTGDAGELAWRWAGAGDTGALADLNRALQREEGSQVLSLAAARARLQRWLAGSYRGVIFDQGGERVAYALFRDTEADSEGPDGVYLRQFYVLPAYRRRGIGRRAIALMRAEILPPARRLVLETTCANTVARQFWEALGLRPQHVRYELPAGAP